MSTAYLNTNSPSFPICHQNYINNYNLGLLVFSKKPASESWTMGSLDIGMMWTGSAIFSFHRFQGQKSYDTLNEKSPRHPDRITLVFPDRDESLQQDFPGQNIYGQGRKAENMFNLWILHRLLNGLSTVISWKVWAKTSHRFLTLVFSKQTTLVTLWCCEDPQ